MVSRYWPFLLILWGLMRLIEVVAYRKRGWVAFTGGEVVDPGHVAVGQKPAQLAFQPVDEIEAGVRRLRGVLPIRMHRVHLVNGRHRLM